MQRALLPIDVCERIIDSCNSCPQFFYPQHLADLRACALTCQDWVPRSRLNLYSSVRLRNVRQLDAFLNTIAAHPFLADFVQELVVGRSTMTPDNPSERYLPFAHAALVSALRGVRRLHLCHYQWQAHHPRYIQLAARYPIVELSLLGGTYQTLADVFRVVWAFEHLQVLRLSIAELSKGSSSLPLVEIIKRRKARICCHLETVMILGPALLGTKTFPPIGCFGNSLTYLGLFWTPELGYMPSEALLLYLSTPSTLQHVAWRADCGAIWKLGDVHNCTLYVRNSLQVIPADGPLRWVTLDFRAPATTGDMSRTLFLEYILGSDLLGIRLYMIVWRLEHFESLTLLVPESDQARFGAAWWRSKVDNREWRHAVTMRIIPASTVWADEATEVAESEQEEEDSDEYFWENGQMCLLSKLFEQL